MAAVEALRRSLGNAMLDGQRADERLQTDIIGGDLTWESSYQLPGEGTPARVRADITLDWPTWSQTAIRSYQLEGELDEPPEIGMEIVMRVQQLAAMPDIQAMRRVLEVEGPDLGHERLGLRQPVVEQGFLESPEASHWAVEFAYDGTIELTEAMIEDLSQLTALLTPVGPWVASTLVRLGDLRLAFLPYHTGD